MTAIAITGTAVTGLLAIRHRLRGPSFGVANACASGTSAIALGADQIRMGRADAMLVGGCESSMRSLMAYASFTTAGMHVTREPRGACTPYAAGRQGFVLAEGAGMLVLERLDRATARGATILGIVAGSAVANDAHHVIPPDASGAAWARAMQLALDDAGISPDQVDAVSAHGTATPQGDIAETRALRQVLGSRAARVAGVGDQVDARPRLRRRRRHRDRARGRRHGRGPGAADDRPRHARSDCDLDHVPHEARRHPVGVLLKNGFGAGGVATGARPRSRSALNHPNPFPSEEHLASCPFASISIALPPPPRCPPRWSTPCSASASPTPSA